MIEISCSIPRNVTLAFSGGVDSVAVADFLRRNHAITLLFVDHGTENSKQALDTVLYYANAWNLPVRIKSINSDKPKNKSQEEFWREQRYSIFHEVKQTVITCHHLDDCVETWIWSSLHGCGKVIPSSNQNVIRPFRTTPKSELINWCNRKGLTWSEDKSNADTKYTRNYIRHVLMPHALQVNPGIHKTIRKKILNEV